MDINNAKKCISDLQEQILIADTRCVSLKSQLDYMKMLYYDVRPETEDFRDTTGALVNRNEAVDTTESALFEEADRYRSLEKVLEGLRSKGSTETSKYSPCDSVRLEDDLRDFSVREEGKPRSVDLDEVKNVKSAKVTPRTSVPPQVNSPSPPMSTRLPREKNLSSNERGSGQEKSYQNNLKDYSTEYQGNVMDLKESLEQLIAEDRNDYLLQKLNSLKEDIKNEESNQNSAHSARNPPAAKHKNPIKKEKKERAASSTPSTKKASSSKVNEIISLRIRKRKGKLRCSTSKSTVATKDTSLVGRRESKKRKQKGSAINDRRVNASKPEANSNDVVELYHNAAAKAASNSVVSSKRSKLDRQTNQASKLPPVANEQHDARVKPKCERDGCALRNVDAQKSERESPNESSRQKKKEEESSANARDESGEPGAETVSTCVGERNNSRQCQHAIIQASYYDSLAAHNYEMPTLASKLKRANRSYFSRFNFRNIPFVVGTSVTPSHNLGLNIQQVLSIMKTRQAAVNGLTPVLIRKVSRGIKPVSVLMEQMSDRCDRSPETHPHISNISEQNTNSLFDHISAPTNDPRENEVSSSRRGNRSSNNEIPRINLSSARQRQSVQQIFARDRSGSKETDAQSENQLSKYQKNGCVFLGGRGASDAAMLKQFASHQNVKGRREISSALEKVQVRFAEREGLLNMFIDKYRTEYFVGLDNGDSSNVNSMAHTHSSKGIREVLINLHDQFEEMNTKYEELQAKAEKYGDKNFEKEISSLEKELNAKEEEINAVVSLYKEVMALKHQMKLLQEKNSFVCISTEVSMNPSKAHASLPFALNRACALSPQEKYHRGKESSVLATREPSASVRLAGLLRQIQTFQKQLKLVS